MATQRLTTYLDSNRVKYEAINHDFALSALEVTQAAHIPGKEFAKPVIFDVDGQPAMVVVRAVDMINLDKLQRQIKSKELKLTNEKDFSNMFPDCEVGAMPPFGNLYGMKVYVNKELTKDVKIAFNAGTHTELYKLAYKDFEKLVKPEILDL